MERINRTTYTLRASEIHELYALQKLENFEASDSYDKVAQEKIVSWMSYNYPLPSIFMKQQRDEVTNRLMHTPLIGEEMVHLILHAVLYDFDTLSRSWSKEQIDQFWNYELQVIRMPNDTTKENVEEYLEGYRFYDTFPVM